MKPVSGDHRTICIAMIINVHQLQSCDQKILCGHKCEDWLQTGFFFNYHNIKQLLDKATGKQGLSIQFRINILNNI